MTKKEAKKILDQWREDFGGVEVVILFKNADGSEVIGDRKPSIDFLTGRDGFAWLPVDESELPHVQPMDLIKFDEAFDLLVFSAPERDLRLQPLRTPHIVEAVNAWKLESPDRMDPTTMLDRLVNEGTI